MKKKTLNNHIREYNNNFISIFLKFQKFNYINSKILFILNYLINIIKTFVNISYKII